MTKQKTIQQFVQGIFANSDHHAKDVMTTFMTIWTALDAKEDVKIKKWRTNIAWFETNKGIYVGTYSHTTKTIDFKRGTQRGQVFKSFNDADKVQDVWQFIMSL